MTPLATRLAIASMSWYAAFILARRTIGRIPQAMDKPTLLPDPTCLHLRLLDASTSTITAIVTTTSPETACPLCYRASTRIHSRYVRHIARAPYAPLFLRE